jgi:hypothetical protein
MEFDIINNPINVSNPINILEQAKSKIITSPFIPNEQRMLELSTLDTEANLIIQKEYNKNKTSSISFLTLDDINKNMSSSVTGFLDDMFAKPEREQWTEYTSKILKKDQRYTYIGILLIIIAIMMMIS